MNAESEAIDTSQESEAVLCRLIRRQEPAKRLAAAVAASNRVAGQCKDAIRRANPGVSEREVNLRFIEINYGADLAAEVRSFLASNK